MIPENNEIANLMGDIEVYLSTPSIERAPEPVGSCRHLKVVLDRQARTVTCRACEKALDPFWYLCLLADEWQLRRYADAMVRQAYQALEQERKNAWAKGKWFARPESGTGAEAWDVFAKLGPVHYICRRRNEWYAGDSRGGETSLSYARMLLAQRQRETGPERSGGE